MEGLIGNNDNIIGIRARHSNDKNKQKELYADFIVDASGRSTNASKWLSEVNAPVPAVETVDAGLGYATGRYRIPEGWGATWKVLLITHAPPENHRLGYLAQVENNEFIATLGGYCKRYPPLEQAAFLQAAQQLPSTEFYDIIAQCMPISKITAYHSTANKLRHYEALKKMPKGFVALGDAVCALCPAYGQGLTTSAIAARVLQDWLTQAAQRSCPLESLAFQKQLAKKLKPAWSAATKSDSGFKTVKGGVKSTAVERALNRYMQRLINKSHTDSELNLMLASINHMVDSPIKLFYPKVLMKVL